MNVLLIIILGAVGLIALIAAILGIGRTEWRKPSDDRLPRVDGNSTLMKPEDGSDGAV